MWECSRKTERPELGKRRAAHPFKQMAFISQRQAIKKLKEETGLNGATCKAYIAKMPKRQDGCRAKVHTKTLKELIDFTNGIREAAETGKVVLSRSAKAKIRAMA